jgi:hypothetical protein
MSLGVYIDCDQCAHVLTAAPLGSGARLRAEARECGWHTALAGGIDLCDECWAQGYRVVIEDGYAVVFMTGRKGTPASPNSEES